MKGVRTGQCTYLSTTTHLLNLIHICILGVIQLHQIVKYPNNQKTARWMKPKKWIKHHTNPACTSTSRNRNHKIGPCKKNYHQLPLNIKTRYPQIPKMPASW